MRESRAGWAVVVAAVLAGPAPARAIETTARRIPVRLVEGRLLLVPVTVNGSGPYPFLLDTGATCSLVDEELADRLRLPRVGSVAHETSIASGSADLVRARVALGGVRRDGALIRARLDSLKDLKPAPRGVVGQDLLRLGNWWLDYRGASLVEDADGSLGAHDLGESLPVHWHDDRPAIDARLPDQSGLRLVLDSAASSPVLFRLPPADERSARVGSARLTTLDGAATVALASVGPMRAGRASIPRLDAAILDEAAARRAEDGLLPTALFQGIYFDNRAGLVVLNPRRSALSGLR
jgi:predicted aspartyl protease